VNPKDGSSRILAPNGTKPLARYEMGFVSTPDGTIYLFDGNCGMELQFALRSISKQLNSQDPKHPT
jgi:hypothetical protein